MYQNLSEVGGLSEVLEISFRDQGAEYVGRHTFFVKKKNIYIYIYIYTHTHSNTVKQDPKQGFLVILHENCKGSV